MMLNNRANGRKYWPLRVLGFSPQYAPHFETRTPRVAVPSLAARTWRHNDRSWMTD